MKKIFIFLLILSVVLSSNLISNQAKILIFPFENCSGEESLFWLGESIAFSLVETLSTYNLQVVAKQQREKAFEELELPSTSSLTRASIIRIGQFLNVSRIIIGEFQTENSEIIITAQWLDLNEGKLGEIAAVKGKLKELLLVQNLLIWELLKKEGIIKDESIDEFLNKKTNIPLYVYENYIKGLISNDLDKKISFFKEAFLNYPNYPEAGWELAKIYYSKKDYRKCIFYLDGVIPYPKFSFPANFLKGLCFFEQEKYEESLNIFNQLEKNEYKSVIYNNIGVCLIKKEELSQAINYFRQGLKEDDSKNGYFNLALAFYSENSLEEAEETIKKALFLDSRDKQSHLLLLSILTKLGKQDLVKNEKEIIRLYFSFGEGEKLDEDSFSFRLINPFINSSSEIKDNQSILNFYINQALKKIESKNWEKAYPALKKALYIQPYYEEIYFLLGKIHYLKKNYSQAIEHLKFSLWLKDSEKTRLFLALCLIKTDQKEKAKSELRKVLAMNPNNEQAKELYQKINK
ncbi:MAG: tetratricopeptide repeat protein [Candidatus Aminicenantia bacterium]